MTLVYMNGFESQDATEIPIGSFAANGRYGSGRSWQITANNNGFFFIPINNNLTQFTAGLAVLRNSSWAVAANIVTFSSNTGDNIRLASTVSNGLQLIQGSTVIYETAPGYLVNGSWYYFELSCVLATSATGSWELRSNGAVLGSGSTVRTAGTDVSFTQIGLNRGGQNVFMDDVYVDDTAGQFKGEISIIGLTPNGNGTYSQLVGSDGNSTDNYLLVDDVPASSADYVGSATAGQKDTYAMTDLPTGTGNILAVRALFTAAKSNANLKKYRYVLRSGGSDQTGSDIFLGGTYAESGEILTQSPFTASAWTESEINGMEVGFEVRS